MRTRILAGAVLLAVVVTGVGLATSLNAGGDPVSGTSGPSAEVLADAATPRDAALVAEQQWRTDAIEYAGALHEQRVLEFKVLAYIQAVEEARAAQAAAEEAARQAEAAAAAAAQPSGGGAGGHLASIRACESGGNYGAVSPSGTYRGAYQFSYETWAAMGGSGDPAAASPSEQDYRAGLLLAQQGSSPWPNCG